MIRITESRETLAKCSRREAFGPLLIQSVELPDGTKWKRYGIRGEWVCTGYTPKEEPESR